MAWNAIIAAGAGVLAALLAGLPAPGQEPPPPGRASTPPGLALADLFASRAVLAVDAGPGGPVGFGPVGMHFLAFARDGVDSFYRDTNGDYYAYFIKMDRDPRGRSEHMVGLALTRDGVTFREVPGPVLRTADDDRAPDGEINSFPSVWKDGPDWYMVTEVDGPGVGNNSVALAVSADGLRWEKRRIILSPRPGGWERLGIGTPYLFKEGGAVVSVLPRVRRDQLPDRGGHRPGPVPAPAGGRRAAGHPDLGRGLLRRHGRQAVDRQGGRVLLHGV